MCLAAKRAKKLDLEEAKKVIEGQSLMSVESWNYWVKKRCKSMW